MKRTLGRIVTKELYTGTFYYRRVSKPRSVKRKDARVRPEEQWIAVQVPALVDQRLFQRAQLQLKRNAELAPRRLGRLYMLRRRLECGMCGRAWIAQTNRSGTKYYICSGRLPGITSNPCRRASISAAKLDPVVWSAIAGLLQDPALVLDQARKRLDREGTISDKEEDLHGLQERVERAHREDERLVRAYKEGVIDLSTLKLERGETAQRIERLQDEHRRLTSELSGWLSREMQLAAVVGAREQFGGQLLALSYESQCEVIQQVVERVIVREAEMEITTIIPGAQDATLRDRRGVDRPAKSKGKHALDTTPGDTVRITLFAELPTPHPRALPGRSAGVA